MLDILGFGGSVASPEGGGQALRRKQNLLLQPVDFTTTNQEEENEEPSSPKQQEEEDQESDLDNSHKTAEFTAKAAPSYVASSYSRFFKPTASTIVKALPAGRRTKNKKE